MIYIITGPRDSGKSAALRKLFHTIGRGDGFLSLKTFDGMTHTGYELERLSTGKRFPLAKQSISMHGTWDHSAACGKYSFSKKGLSHANTLITDLISSNMSPIFIDEVGKLELSGSGYVSLEKALASNSDVIMTVKDKHVAQVVQEFKIKEYVLLHISELLRTSGGSYERFRIKYQ